MLQQEFELTGGEEGGHLTEGHSTGVHGHRHRHRQVLPDAKFRGEGSAGKGQEPVCAWRVQVPSSPPPPPPFKSRIGPPYSCIFKTPVLLSCAGYRVPLSNFTKSLQSLW